MGARKEPTVPGSLDRPDRPYAPDQPDASELAGRLRYASPRADSPPVTGRPGDAGPADRLARADQPTSWSREDLRQRLERLSPGHPSSLRDDGQDRDQTRADGDLDEADREADAVKRDYWSEVPGFLRMLTDHERRWPAERTATTVDRSSDPAGSWRGDGNQYLSPEQHMHAKVEIAKVREREATLTLHMTEVRHENSCGGWLEGLEHRRKGDDRLKEKIAEVLKRMPDKRAADVVRMLPDAIRYTFCFQPGNYAAGYGDVKRSLEERGYSMIYSKNHWNDDPQYKGINTRWVTTEGQRFEVQFHTPQSYHAKEVLTHRSYERLRNPLTGDNERHQLRSYQREVCQWINVPADVQAIPDYLRKGHN
jgi:hypothetical protein